jgi:polygalacturonase
MRLFAIACAVGVSLNSIAGDWGATPKVALPNIPKRVVNVADCGGVGDGLKLNTEAFARAIAALSQKGGGKLVVPPGIWLTGPIELSSNIELYVQRGALLQFSGDASLYPLRVIDMKGERDVDSTSPLFGQNLENVAICGEGIIDGAGDAWRPVKKSKLTEGDWNALVKSGGVLNARGDTWWPSRAAMEGEKAIEELRRRGSLQPAEYEPWHQFLRPRMVRLIGVKRLLIQNVTFRNPPNWTLNPALSEDVSILNVEVRNSPAAQNSDALDLESCRRAVIRGCIFETGDDGICLKSGKDAPGRRIGVPTEDVLIEGCTVYHAHGGITIGSEMSGGVRNIRVTNCTFIGTDIGLRFKSARGRGGVVERIRIAGVRMREVPGDAISFTTFYGGGAPLEEMHNDADASLLPVTEETPQFRDIHIENLVCRGARNAIMMQGLPEMPLRNITLKDVSITAQQGVSLTDVENVTFENVSVDVKAGAPIRTLRVKSSRLELRQ